jgi:hypothetical protein
MNDRSPAERYAALLREPLAPELDHAITALRASSTAYLDAALA